MQNEDLTAEQLATLESYYNTYFSLFKTSGWQQLMDDLRQDAQRLNSIQSIENEKELFDCQGQLKAVAWLLNFEETCEQTWEGIQAQRQIPDA